MIRLSQRLLLSCVIGCSAICGSVFAGAADESATPAPSPAKAKSSGSLKVTEDLILRFAKVSEITSDSVRQAVGYIQKYQPLVAAQLEDQLQNAPDKLKASLRQASYEERNLDSLRRNNPAAYKRREQLLTYQARIDLLLERYKTAAETEKPQLEADIVKLLAQQFDLRIQDERAQLEQQRRALEQATERLVDRENNKDRIVDRQVTRLLGIDDILAW